MREDYQHKRNNPYQLPKTLYLEIKGAILDYPRKRQEYQNIMASSPIRDGQPKGNGLSNPTEAKAIKLEALHDTIKPIEQAAMVMIGYYSDRIDTFDPVKAFNHYEYFSIVTAKKQTDETPSRKTWYRYKSRFAYFVAEKMKKI